MTMLRALLLLLGGCGTVFQLDHVDEEEPVEEQPLVTGTYLFTDVEHDGPKVRPPPDGAIVLTLLRENGTASVPIDPVTGEFSFRYGEGRRYRLVVTGLDTYPIEYVSTSRTLKLGHIAFGRRLRDPVTAPTTVRFYTNAATTGRYTRIASTGHRTFTNSAGTSTAFVEWLNARGVDEMGALPGLIADTLGDVVHYLSFETVGGVYTRVAQHVTGTGTMRSGVPLEFGTAQVPLVVAPVLPNRCVYIRAPIAAESTRLQGLLGHPFLSQDESWSLSSVPARELGAGGRIQIVQDNTTTMDAAANVVYGNPLAGELEVAQMTLMVRRALYFPGLTNEFGLPLTTNIWMPVDPTPDVTTCAANVVDLGSLRAPILDTAALDGTTLTADNQAVTLTRGSLVPFSFTFGSADPYDSVQLQIWEVVNASGATELRPQRQIVAAATTEVELDPALFLLNRRYIISVSARTLYPGAADGNFVDQALPTVSANHFTPMFQVVN